MKLSLSVIGLLILVLLIGGCGTEEPPSGGAASGTQASEQTGESAGMLTITSFSSIRLIRPDNCSEQAKLTIGEVSRKLSALTGASVQNLTESAAAKGPVSGTVNIWLGQCGAEAPQTVLQGLSYGEYGVYIVGDAIVVAAWSDSALSHACSNLLNLLSLASENGVIRVNSEHNRTLIENQTLAAIPKYSDSAVKTVYDCGDEGWMVCLASDRTEFERYLAELPAEGFVKHSENRIGSNAFAVYQTERYILNAGWYEGTGEVRLFIDPADDCALPIQSPSGATVCTPTMAQLRHLVPGSTTALGMGYVFRASDGRFVLIDGGVGNSGEEDYLFDYLCRNAPDPGDIRIAAWFFTHGHGDHVGLFHDFAAKYAEQVTVEQFVYNRPSNSYHAALPEGLWEQTEAAIQRYFPNAGCVKAHPGQAFSVADLTIEVYFGIELYAPENGRYNDTSLVLSAAFAGTRLLFMGDSSDHVEGLIRTLYGLELKSDFLQLAHHGYAGGGTNGELYRLVAPDYVLMPGTMEVYEERKGRSYLQPLVEAVPFERWFVADICTYVFDFGGDNGVSASVWA